MPMNVSPLDFPPAVRENSSAGKKIIASHQLNSSARLKPALKTSISSIQCGSQARPFDGIVIFLQRARRVRFP